MSTPTSQTTTPTTPLNSDTIAAIHAELVGQADAAHTQYPQYADHWNAWVVARATKDITHRGAVIVRRDEFVLMNPESIGWSEMIGRTTVTIYCHANRVDTTRFANEFATVA